MTIKAAESHVATYCTLCGARRGEPHSLDCLVTHVLDLSIEMESLKARMRTLEGLPPNIHRVVVKDCKAYICGGEEKDETAQ